MVGHSCFPIDTSCCFLKTFFWYFVGITVGLEYRLHGFKASLAENKTKNRLSSKIEKAGDEPIALNSGTTTAYMSIPPKHVHSLLFKLSFLFYDWIWHFDVIWMNDRFKMKASKLCQICPMLYTIQSLSLKPQGVRLFRLPDKHIGAKAIAKKETLCK